jgi:hypothetical protein
MVSSITFFQEMLDAGFNERDYNNFSLLHLPLQKVSSIAGIRFQMSEEKACAYRELKKSVISKLSRSDDEAEIQKVVVTIAKMFFLEDREFFWNLLTQSLDTLREISAQEKGVFVDRIAIGEIIRNWERLDPMLKKDQRFSEYLWHLTYAPIEQEQKKIFTRLVLQEQVENRLKNGEQYGYHELFRRAYKIDFEFGKEIEKFAAGRYPAALLERSSGKESFSLFSRRWFACCIQKVHRKNLYKLLVRIAELYQEQILTHEHLFANKPWQMRLLALSMLPRFSENMEKIQEIIFLLNCRQRPLREALRNIHSGLLLHFLEFLLTQFPPITERELELFFQHLPLLSNGKIDPKELQKKITFLNIFLCVPTSEGKSRLEEILVSSHQEQILALKTCVGEFLRSYGAADVETIQKSKRLAELVTYLRGLRVFEAAFEGKSRFVQKIGLSVGRLLCCIDSEEHFREERYRVEGSLHLQKLEREYPAVWQAWKQIQFSSEQSPVQKKSCYSSFNEFLQEKILQNRLPDALVSALHVSREERQGELPNGLEQCFDFLKHCKMIEGELEEEVIQEGIELFKTFCPDYAFSDDLKILLPKMTDRGRTIELSDCWEDLLVCGTDVPGSCQRVDGDPVLNKCLLAYLLDGKNRLLCIKDEQGRLVSRVILRLLLEKSEGPVVYMGALYGDSSYEESLIEAAETICKTLQLPLYLYGTGTALYSLGSSVPYEYSDDEGSVMLRGAFTLEGEKVFSPIEER